jgi:hypothetical protein
MHLHDEPQLMLGRARLWSARFLPRRFGRLPEVALFRVLGELVGCTSAFGHGRPFGLTPTTPPRKGSDRPVRYLRVVWSAIGAILSAIGGIAALVRSRYPVRSGYEADYGMTPRSHLRFAWVSAGFLAAFLLTAFVHAIPAIPIVAVYVLLLILYATSFARGFAR